MSRPRSLGHLGPNKTHATYNCLRAHPGETKETQPSTLFKMPDRINVLKESSTLREISL